MVIYADDLRFPNKAEQKEQYSTIDSDITDTKIVELKKVNVTSFEVTIEVVDEGNLNKFTFSVEKQKKVGKLLLDKTYNVYINKLNNVPQ